MFSNANEIIFNCRNCLTNSLDDNLVNGKIVLCEGDLGVPEAFRVGAVGILMQEKTYIDMAISFPLPACFLPSRDVLKIHIYLRSTRYQAQISYAHIIL